MTKINEIKMQLDSVKKNFAKEADHAITNGCFLWTKVLVWRIVFLVNDSLILELASTLTAPPVPGACVGIQGTQDASQRFEPMIRAGQGCVAWQRACMYASVWWVGLKGGGGTRFSSTPTFSKPRPCVRGRRPVAYRTASQTT